MRVLIVALAILVLVPVARAWDATGHRVIAYIAWQEMTPEARAAVMEIMRYAPVQSGLYGLFPRDGRPLSVRELQYFMDAAVWADMVRDRRDAERFERYHHSSWHYTNIFWEEGPGGPVVRDDLQAEPVNIEERLRHLEAVVADARYPKAHRAVVIAWLEHLVGDIHQPLHASARVTEEEPEGDRGGNLFRLGERDNLHSYWDRRLTEGMPRRRGEGDAAYAGRLGEALRAAYPSSNLEMEGDDHGAWVERGFRLASTELYAGLTRGEAPPAAYAEKAAPLAAESIALAGYRLGRLMNRLFG